MDLEGIPSKLEMDQNSPGVLNFDNNKPTSPVILNNQKDESSPPEDLEQSNHNRK